MTATIYRYQPVVIAGPTGTDYRPTGPDGEGFHDTLTDLCECDGWRYVAVPAGITPLVPVELTTWSAVELTAELRDQIKQASSHCQLARERFVAAIRARHSLDDELYYARIATGSMLGSYTLQPGEAELLAGYQTDVETARATLHERYAELGV
jgi:hypothetical protein